MNPSTNLVRACRDSGLDGSDIEGLVRALHQPRSGARRRAASAAQGGSLVTSAVAAFARTLLATLR